MTGRVQIPGSKSETNRALILASLAIRPVSIYNPLAARDTELMARALTGFGARIARGQEMWRVTPAQQITSPGTIDCGLAGTVMRFCPPIALLAPEPTDFVGDAQAGGRPMGGLLSGLRQLGAAVSGDSLPFRVTPPPMWTRSQVSVDAASSSQFVSGLLLAAPRYPNGLRVDRIGQIPSAPHVDMTVEMLRRSGVAVRSGPDWWQVSPGQIVPGIIHVDPDLTNASAFLAAAAATGGCVTVPNWPETTTQAGDRIREILTQFGARVEFDSSSLRVTGDELAGININLRSTSELTPVVAALAALAHGDTVITGVGHIRGHETDRIAALATELSKVGAKVTPLPDGMHISPRPLRPATLQSHADHRMVHAFSIIGLHTDVEIAGADAAAKTMPDFTDRWQELVQG